MLEARVVDEKIQTKQAVKSSRELINKSLEYILQILKQLSKDIREKDKFGYLQTRLERLGKAFMFLQESFPSEFNFANKNQLHASLSDIRITLSLNDNSLIAEFLKETYACFLKIVAQRESANYSEIITAIKKIQQNFDTLEGFDLSRWTTVQLAKFKPVLPSLSTEASQKLEPANLSHGKEILIPADGDCLYTAVFLDYLLPAIDNWEQFNVRLLQLTGQTLEGIEAFRNALLSNFYHVNFLQSRELKLLINLFRKNMGIGRDVWGGPEEIKIIEEKLNIAIQELIANPDDSLSTQPYVELDKKTLDLQYERICILRSNPKIEEVVDRSHDLSTQLGLAVSAISSTSLQYYRLISMAHVERQQRIADKPKKIFSPTEEKAMDMPLETRELLPSASNKDQIKINRGEGGKYKTANKFAGIEYRLGITPAILKELREMGTVDLIPKMLEIILQKAKIDELEPEIFKVAIDTAAETLKLIEEKSFDHVKTLLEANLVKNISKVNKYASFLIKVFESDQSEVEVTLTLGEVIETLKVCMIAYLESTKDQDLYTPLEGYYDTLSSNPEKFKLLEEMVVPFLENPNLETVLLLGEAGSGKTKFSEQLTVYLWQYSNFQLIPIYIRLVDPNIKDLKEHLIEDALKAYGLTAQEVKVLLENKEKSFCFIFDGVEELIRKNKDYTDFYHTNQIHFKFPKSRCVFTGRRSGLPAGYEPLFTPMARDGERLFSRQGKIINLAPFNEGAKKNYIEKFLKKREVSELGYKTPKEVYERIESISNLNDIVGRPILLMMTMCVLPYMEGFYQQEKRLLSFEVIQKDLFHMYTHDLYVRAADKVFQSIGVIAVGVGKVSTIYECILDYSIKLAKLMNHPDHRLNEVSEDEIFNDEDDSEGDVGSTLTEKQMREFKKFFCRDYDETIYTNKQEYERKKYGREGCDLLDPRGIPGHLVYRFIHDDFLDYFATLLPQTLSGRRTKIKDYMDECIKANRDSKLIDAECNSFSIEVNQNSITKENFDKKIVDLKDVNVQLNIENNSPRMTSLGIKEQESLSQTPPTHSSPEAPNQPKYISASETGFSLSRFSFWTTIGLLTAGIGVGIGLYTSIANQLNKEF